MLSSFSGVTFSWRCRFLRYFSVRRQVGFIKAHLFVSLSQVIDKFHCGGRNGIVLHDIPDILLDISA